MVRNLFISCILLLFHSLTLESLSRALGIDDYFALRSISNVRISPDGKWVAYVVSHSEEESDENFSNIYMVSMAGGAPVQVTSSGNDFEPRWSADNQYLSFLSSRTGKSQVYVIARNGGEAKALTNVPQGVDFYEWAPDGKKMLFVLTDPESNTEEKVPPPYVITRLLFKADGVGYVEERYKHIYVFDVDSKGTKQLTFGPYNDSGYFQNDYISTPQWSPDGKQILFVSNRTPEPDSTINTDVFIISTEGGEPKRVTTQEGVDQMPSWSRDGKSIVYVAMMEPRKLWFDQLLIARISAEGGEPEILTKNLDRNAVSPTFGPDGRIYFLLEDQGNQRLVSIPPNGGPIQEAVPEKVVHEYDLSNHGSIASLVSRPDLPGDIFATTSAKAIAVTNINENLLRGIELAKTRSIEFRSVDGARVHGFVFTPPGFDPSKKYPAILWIRGGPNGQDAEEFSFRSQFLAAQGYVLIAVNYRGSSGFGKDFQQAIYANWGTLDVKDLLAGVDHVTSLGFVDPDRIAMGGHSYGAMLTNFLLAETNRFKAAITDAGESNYLMNYGVDQFFLDWETELGKPWENPQRFIEMSPFFRLKNAKTPTLVVCGQEDWNVPLINSEQLYLALRRMGVDAMLVVYPEQSHEFDRPSYIKDRFLRYLAWYDHFLKGAPSKVPVLIQP